MKKVTTYVPSEIEAAAMQYFAHIKAASKSKGYAELIRSGLNALAKNGTSTAKLISLAFEKHGSGTQFVSAQIDDEEKETLRSLKWTLGFKKIPDIVCECVILGLIEEKLLDENLKKVTP
ncbi:MAG: hypothetical protein ABJO52_11195 [Nisaea sp.]